MLLTDLFDALTLESFQSLVDLHQEEHLSLEFKTVTTSDLTAGGDKRNFAEALSGFSNSAGGVILWGVTTQKNSAGQDVAAKLSPILNVSRFASRLDEFTPLLLTPNASGVLHRSFGREDGSGFAASFVPESNAGPHMALAGHHRYFKRAGDRFYPMEHFDVADMFGRRQRPALRVISSVIAGSSYGGPQGSRREVRILLTLINDGRGSAVAPYLRLETNRELTVAPLGVTSPQPGASLRLVGESISTTRIASVVGTSEFIIHPRVSFQIAQLSCEFWDHESLPDLPLHLSLAALNSPLVENRLIVSADEIATALGRIVQAGRR